jgi:hypothetical protein
MFLFMPLIDHVPNSATVTLAAVVLTVTRALRPSVTAIFVSPYQVEVDQASFPPLTLAVKLTVPTLFLSVPNSIPVMKISPDEPVHDQNPRTFVDPAEVDIEPHMRSFRNALALELLIDMPEDKELIIFACPLVSVGS